MPCGCMRREGEIEIGGERLARVIAVDMPEAHRPAERLFDIVHAQVAHVRLDRCIALAREPMPRAMRMEQVEQAFVRPVERVDAERLFAGR